MSKTLGVLALASLVSTLSVGSITAQFIAADPLNEHGYIDRFESINAELAADLNNDFVLPTQVYLTSAKCGDVNAYYVPSQKQIIFCSEFIDLLVEQAESILDDDLSQRNSMAGPIISILFHEVGHALIDVLDLPVLGGEETAADQLASLLMSDEPLLAMWAASLWQSLSGGQYPSADQFSDTHGLVEQRYYNLMCWTYGADPQVRDYVVAISELPLERAQRCGDEYNQMRAAWGQLLAPYLRNPRTFLARDPRKNTSGSWRFRESMRDEAGNVECTGSGTLRLWQTASDLSGSMVQTGACMVSGRSSDSSVDFEFEAGVVSENVIGFDVGPCRYTAVMKEPDFLVLEGTVTCPNLSGPWSAER